MCPKPILPRLDQEALDRLHEIAVQSERVQTAAESLAGRGHGSKVARDTAHAEARRLLGMSRLIVSSAEKLVSVLAEPDDGGWTPSGDPASGF